MYTYSNTCKKSMPVVIMILTCNNCSNQYHLEKKYQKNDYTGIVQYCFSKIHELKTEDSREVIIKDIFPFFESKNDEKLYKEFENNLLRQSKDLNNDDKLKKFDIIVRIMTEKGRLVNDDWFVDLIVNNNAYSLEYRNFYINKINRNKMIKRVINKFDDPIKNKNYDGINKLFAIYQLEQSEELKEISIVNNTILQTVIKKYELSDQISNTEESLKKLLGEWHEIKSRPVPQETLIKAVVLGNKNLGLGEYGNIYLLAIGSNRIEVASVDEKFAKLKYGDSVSMWVERLEVPGAPRPVTYMGSSESQQKKNIEELNNIEYKITKMRGLFLKMKNINYDQGIELEYKNLTKIYEKLKNKYSIND